MRLQIRHDSTGWQLLSPGRVMLPDGGQEVCSGAREGSGREPCGCYRVWNLTRYGPHGQHGTVKGSGAWTSWTAWWKKKALSHELDEEVVKITDLLLILKHRFQKKT